MKLKLEHLKKFPFYEDQQVPGLLVQFGEEVLFPASKSNLEFIIEKQLKPLLRPLSELKFKKTSFTNLSATLKQELDYISKTKDCSNLKSSTKKFLIKNLFDIDGLIEAGLALHYNFEWKCELQPDFD